MVQIPPVRQVAVDGSTGGWAMSLISLPWEGIGGMHVRVQLVSWSRTHQPGALDVISQREIADLRAASGP